MKYTVEKVIENTVNFNTTGNVRVKKHCDVFAYRTYFLSYPNSLRAVHSKRAFLWRLIITSNNKI